MKFYNTVGQTKMRKTGFTGCVVFHGTGGRIAASADHKRFLHGMGAELDSNPSYLVVRYPTPQQIVTVLRRLAEPDHCAMTFEEDSSDQIIKDPIEVFNEIIRDVPLSLEPQGEKDAKK